MPPRRLAGEPDLVEEVVVRSCVRRGVAIDLVLDRSRESRSQFVVTTLKGGREGIFWQTARTTRKTRPGMRLPTRRSAMGVLEVVVDTRERYAWKFERWQAVLTKRALIVGDYAVEVDGEVVGVVERKKLAELASNVVDGSLLIRLGELAAARRAAIVVEDRWADVFRLTFVSPSMVAEMLAAAQVRYPTFPSCSARTASSPRSGPTGSSVLLPTPTRRPSTWSTASEQRHWRPARFEVRSCRAQQ